MTFYWTFWVIRVNYQYLGIMIDATLTWKPHIEKICKTISRSIGILYKIRPFVDIKILKTLYYSLIYPHLIYAIEVWGSADSTHMNHIIILQKRIVRTMKQLDKRQSDFAFPPADPLFLPLGFLIVHDPWVHELKIATFIYKSLNKQNPTNFHSWFKLTTQIHSHNTRSKFIDIVNARTSNNLFIPIACTSHYGLKSVKVQGPKIWNMLPPDIRKNISSPVFY